jgi:hypothetical protein
VAWDEHPPYRMAKGVPYLSINPRENYVGAENSRFTFVSLWRKV